MTEPDVIVPENECCAPCPVHSNPPNGCLDCGHCHPCHLARDFPPGARVIGEHPVPIKVGIRDAQVFRLAHG